jgi:hypothetical protein
LSASADRRWLLFWQAERDEGGLMLVENFR